MTRLFWNINKFTQFSSVYDTAGNEVRLFGKSIPDQLASLANVVASCHDDVVVWRNITDDGHAYYAYFNLSEEPQTVTMNVDKSVENPVIRDLWERKDLGEEVKFTLQPHSCRAFKI